MAGKFVVPKITKVLIALLILLVGISFVFGKGNGTGFLGSKPTPQQVDVKCSVTVDNPVGDLKIQKAVCTKGKPKNCWASNILPFGFFSDIFSDSGTVIMKAGNEKDQANVKVGEFFGATETAILEVTCVDQNTNTADIIIIDEDGDQTDTKTVEVI